MPFSAHLLMSVYDLFLGICITISSFAVLVTGPIVGTLLENAGVASYLPMQLFTALSLTFSGALFVVTRLRISWGVAV